MKKKVIATIILVLVLGFAGISDADIVELDLFSIGCPTEFDFDAPYWQAEFDLGVEFFEIDNVYMDWSGEITAGFATDPTKPVPQPFPLDVGIGAYLGSNPWPRLVSVWGGDTYPAPEPFDCLSEFELLGTTTWSDLLDEQGTIWIDYRELVGPSLIYVESGLVYLERITLVIDGTVVPEPATILLIVAGIIGIRVSKK